MLTPLQRLSSIPEMSEPLVKTSTGREPSSQFNRRIRDELIQHVKNGVIKHIDVNNTLDVPLKRNATERLLTLELDILFAGKETSRFTRNLKNSKIIEKELTIDEKAPPCSFQVVVRTSSEEEKNERRNEALKELDRNEDRDVEKLFNDTSANTRIGYVEERLDYEVPVDSVVSFGSAPDIQPLLRSAYLDELPDYGITEINLDDIKKEIIGRLTNYRRDLNSNDRDLEKLISERFMINKQEREEDDRPSHIKYLNIDSGSIENFLEEYDLLSDRLNIY